MIPDKLRLGGEVRVVSLAVSPIPEAQRRIAQERWEGLGLRCSYSANSWVRDRFEASPVEALRPVRGQGTPRENTGIDSLRAAGESLSLPAKGLFLSTSRTFASKLRCFAARATAISLLALLSLVFAVACAGEGSRPTRTLQDPPDATAAKRPAPRVAEDGVIFALLADGGLATFSLASGRAEGKIPLGRFPDPGVGRYLAPSRDGRTLFALLPGTRDGPSRVAAVDVATTHARGYYRLPEGIVFRSLAVGPKTGRLYLFGNRPEGAVEGSGGDPPEDAVVAVVGPSEGRLLESRTIREADDTAWRVYTGEVSPDERRLFVSYHGGASGVDWVEVAPDGLDRCEDRASTGTPCFPAHSGVVVREDGRFLTSPGDGPWVEERYRNGALVRRWDTGLEGNHMLDLAVDQRADRLYVLGSCGYTGGLSKVDLGTGRVKMLAGTRADLGSASSREGAVCGARVAVGPGSLLVVGKTQSPVPQPGVPGSLLLIDGDEGRKIRVLDATAEPVDVLVVSRS